MKHLKLKNDEITYPYSISDLKKDNPNTSFPDKIGNELLKEYGIFPVQEIEVGNDYNKNYTEETPKLIDEEYFQVWNESEATQEEIDSRKSGKWVMVRSERNAYLKDSDWTQLRDAPFSESKRGEWVQYRQALRDITKQTDPFNIAWPVKPL